MFIIFTNKTTKRDNDQRPKWQSLRKSKEVMGVGQSLMLSGARNTKNQNTNNHQVFVHFVLVKDSLNYQLELVVNVEPPYSRWFLLLSKRCNTWSMLLHVLPLLSPQSIIERSKKARNCRSCEQCTLSPAQGIHVHEQCSYCSYALKKKMEMRNTNRRRTIS